MRFNMHKTVMIYCHLLINYLEKLWMIFKVIKYIMNLVKIH